MRAGALLLRRLVLHAVAIAGDSCFDQAVDVFTTAMKEGLHKPKLGKRFGKVCPRIADGLALSRSFINHAIVPFGEGRADDLASARAKTIGGMTVVRAVIAVAKAVALTDADSAKR